MCDFVERAIFNLLSLYTKWTQAHQFSYSLTTQCNGIKPIINVITLILRIN